MSSSRDGFVNNSRQIGPPLCEGADIPCKKWRSPSLSFLYYNFVLRMNNVNDRAPTALSPISGSKPFMWRTVGAKVKPFSESAKSIDSFFRADAQEKARRLILPLKRSRRARRNNSSINRAGIAFAVTKVRLFSLQTNLSKSFFNRFDKKQPPKKRTPSQERRQKGADI